MFADIKINHPAPNFKLKGVLKNQESVYNLSQMRGSWVLLFFYLADFNQICEDEVIKFHQKLPEFKKYNCQIFGCSTDSHYSHKAWAESLGGIDFPLLADVHHTTAIDYNVFVEEEAVCLSGSFLIDPTGVLKYYQISDPKITRNIDELLRILDVLK